MKKISVIIVLFMFSIVSLNIGNLTAKASSDGPFQQENVSDNQIEFDTGVMQNLEKSLSFDLTKNEKQEVKFINEQNKITTVGIEPVTNSLQRVANGTWKIYYYNLGTNVKFYINISNNTITKAYDPSYIIIGAAVKSSRLVRDSNKQATYYFEFGTPVWDFGGWSGHLRAKINSSNKLVTSVK